MVKAVIGIDPGQSGGISVIADNGNGVLQSVVHKMPETLVDIVYLLREIRAQWGEPHVFIERVGAMPKQGVSSTWKFAFHTGSLMGVIAGLGLEVTQVRPMDWQKTLGCLTGGDKNISKNRAQQLFPHLKIIHATADALLIGKYGFLKLFS